MTRPRAVTLAITTLLALSSPACRPDVVGPSERDASAADRDSGAARPDSGAADSAAGADSVAGPDSAIGQDSATGQDGATGSDSATGPDTAAGPDSATGQDGATGPDSAGDPDAAELDQDQDGYTIAGGDCDDRDPTVHPYAIEIPFDWTDQDCDGEDEVAPEELVVSAGTAWNIDAAGDASGFFAVYQRRYLSQPAVFGRRLDGNGQPMGAELNVNRAPTGDHIASAPAVATDGTRYLVAWGEAVTSGQTTTHYVYGQWVSAQGSLSGDHFTIASSSRYQSPVAVASNGQVFLVVWLRQTASGGQTVHGRVVNADASMTSAVDLYQPGDAAAHLYAPTLASDGTSFLLSVGSDYNTTGDPGNIVGLSISAAGALLGPLFAVCTAAGAQLYPRLAFNTDRYLLVTTDGVDLLAGQYIDPSGALIGTIATEPFALCSDCSRRGMPALAASGAGFITAWLDDRFGSPRALFGRRLGTEPEDMTPALPMHATSHTLAEARVYQGQVTTFVLGVRETDDLMVSFRVNPPPLD